MIPNIYIKRVKPSINKMKAADLKALGFKTKAIAKTFAKLSDVTAANYKTEHDFIEALKHKINNFKKLGLEFNNAFKNHDVSTPKVKANREAKLEKKNQELLGWPALGDEYCNVGRRRSWTWIKLAPPACRRRARPGPRPGHLAPPSLRA